MSRPPASGALSRRRALLGLVAVVGAAITAACDSGSPGTSSSASPSPVSDASTRVVSIRYVARAEALSQRAGVEITVTSERAFPVRNEIVELRIGATAFSLSRYPKDGDTHTLIFTLTPEQWQATREGDPVDVHYGQGGPPEWSFGGLHKGTVQTTG